VAITDSQGDIQKEEGTTRVLREVAVVALPGSEAENVLSALRRNLEDGKLRKETKRNVSFCRERRQGEKGRGNGKYTLEEGSQYDLGVKEEISYKREGEDDILCWGKKFARKTGAADPSEQRRGTSKEGLIRRPAYC